MLVVEQDIDEDNSNLTILSNEREKALSNFSDEDNSNLTILSNLKSLVLIG
mgnify:CR=1 FL=1